MLQEPFSALFDSDADASARARLLEIVAAANQSATVSDLASYALDTLQVLFPFRLGFFLLCNAQTLRVVPEQPRRVPPDLRDDLSALGLPPEFFTRLNTPDAFEPLADRVRRILRAHKITAPLITKLQAGQTAVGLLVLAGDPHPEMASAWHAFAARQEFWDIVGAQLGTAFQRIGAHNALATSEKWLREFLNQVENGFWETDAQGRITRVNEAALRTLKRGEKEVIGKRIDELSDADPEGLRELRQRLQREGLVRDFILHVRAKDGEIRTIRESLQVIKDANGNVTAMQGIFRDITETRATFAELTARNQELQLLQELASRLNNTMAEHEALNAGLDLIAKLTHAEAVGIVLINKEEGHYDLVAQHGLEPALVQAYQTAPFDRAIYESGFNPETTWNLIEYIVLTRRVLTLDQLRAMPRFDVQPILAFGYQTLLTFPIGFDNNVYAVAMVGSKTLQQFDDHDIQLVTSISAQLGLKLHTQQLVSALKRQVEEMRSVIRTGHILQAAPYSASALPHVLGEIRQALNATYVVLHLVRDDHFEYVTATDTREPGRTFRIAEYEQRLLNSNQPLIVRDRDDPNVDAEQHAILSKLELRASFGLRLFVQDRPIGLLFVNQDTRREWHERDARLIQAFAQQLANTLENQQLLDKVTRQVGELKALARVGRFIGAVMPPDRALYSVADEIRRVFGADYVSFHMRSDNMLRLVAESHPLSAATLLPTQPYQHQILEELYPLRVNDSEKDPVHPLQLDYLRRYNIIADLGVPLVSGQKALGIMYICYHRAHCWSDDEVQLAETFAQQTAAALTTARLYRESLQQTQGLRSLARNANLIAQTRSAESTLPYVASDIRRALGADYCGFHLLKGDRFHIITETEQYFNTLVYPVHPYHHLPIQYFQKIITTDRDLDAKDEIHRAILAEHNFRADLGVPMVARNKTIGILFVSQRTRRVWQAHEIHFLESYAQQIANVLENVQLLNEKEARVRELTQLIELNELTTGIFNEQILLDTVLEPLQSLLKADRVLLSLVRDGQVVRVHSSDGVVYPQQPPPMTTWLQKVINEKQICILDEKHQPTLDGDFAERAAFYNLKACLIIPVITAAETIGLLSFHFHTPRVFTDAEIRLAQSAANQVSMAFANAHLLEDKETRIDKLMQLAEFGLWCGTVNDSHTLTDESIEKIRAMLRVRAASVRLVQDGKLTTGASAGYKNPEAREHSIAINPPLHRVLIQQKPYPIFDLETEPNVLPHWRERHLQEGFRSLLMVPMLANRQVMGILTIFEAETHKWQQAEIQFAQAAANTLALALTNAQQIEKVQQKSAELRAILDSVFSGVFTTDDEGVIQTWNRAAQQITGLTEQDLRGKCWHVDGPRAGAHRRPDNIVLEAMAEKKVQFSVAPRFLTRPDGKVIQLREAAAPLLDVNGKVRGAVCAFWDRTSEQAAERAKVDLLNLLGHQLGNKLSAMLWSAQELQHKNLNARSRTKHLDIIADTQRELQAFNKRLNAFQQEHMQEAVEESQVDLRALVRRKLVRWRLTHPEHRFRMQGAFDHVLADEMRLDVVIENLLDNACKYSPPGSWITLRGRLPNSDTLQLDVHNAGKPIPPELQARLFERGQRGESDQPGSGLGLWLVQTKLHEVGGDIHIESHARRGTTFCLTLRRPKPPAPPDAKKE